MSANADFGLVASTTLNNMSKVIGDNVSNHIPLYKYLKIKGAVIASGGDKIVRPLLSEFSNAQAINGTDTIDITKPDGVSAAEYNWKLTVCPIIIDDFEEAQNSGKEKRFGCSFSKFLDVEISTDPQNDPSHWHKPV